MILQPPPCPSAESLNPFEYSFVWDEIPGAVYYQIGYLNLRSGDEYHTETTDNHFFHTNPNPGLDHFLFTFSSVVHNNRLGYVHKSGSFIIIDEKLIIINFPDDDPEFRLNNKKDDHNSILQNLNIYPNPGKESFLLEYELLREQEISMTLIDAMGRTILHVKKPEVQSAGFYQLPFYSNDLSSGLYICCIKTKNELKNLQLIIN